MFDVLVHDFLSCVFWAEAGAGIWSYWEGGGVSGGHERGGSGDFRMGRAMEP